MQTKELIRVSDVFGVKRAHELDNYVSRNSVDEMFIDALHSGKHVAVFGASKTGKSSLIEKQVGLKERLYVQCTDEFKVDDFSDALLEAVYGRADHEETESEHEETLQTSDAGIRINSRNLIGSIKRRFRRQNRKVLRISDKKVYDLKNIGDFKTLFEDIGYSKHEPESGYLYLIIDDFHKSSRAAQRWLANVAKMLFDNTRVIFIFVGIWVEERILSALCPELSARAEDINCNVWSTDELSEVVDNGCKRLNIYFPAGFTEEIVKQSHGSVYILQESCKEACRQAGIRSQGLNKVVVQKTLNAPKIVKEVTGRYCDFTDTHGELLRLKKDNKSILFVYHAMISRDVRASPSIDMDKLQSRIESEFPDLTFGENFAYNACVRFAKHQDAQKFQSIYRIHKLPDSNKVFISLVDKTFNIWLKGKRPRILKDIEEKIRRGKKPKILLS